MVELVIYFIDGILLGDDTMDKRFSCKIIEEEGNKKVLFLNSLEQEITKHVIKKNETGQEYFDMINPYINYDNLEIVKKPDIDMSFDNIGDCIQSVIDGYGDKMVVKELSLNSFSANVVKYADEDFGKKERQDVLEEYENIVWKYSVKLVPLYSNFDSYVIQKDGVNYIKNLLDDSDKAIKFDSSEDAKSYIDSYLAEAIEYHVGNRLSAFKKSRRSDIISDNDPEDILKVALRYSDMTGTQLEKKYELKVIQIMV